MLPLICAVSACFLFVRASPLSTDSDVRNLETRQAVDCNNSTSGASSTCWDELAIPDYLLNWNRTTPICAGSDDGHDCCLPKEPWSTCFLRLAYGRPGYDCTPIISESCSINQLSPSLDPSIASKVRYVVQNIVSINNVFASINTGLERGLVGGQNELMLPGFLQTTTPNAAVLNNGNVYKALVAGLPFWAASSVMASEPQQFQSDINPAAAQAFETGLQNTQGVRSILFGGAYNAQDALSTGFALASATDNVGILLLSALSLIMSDVPTFSAWAAHGLYSGSDQVTVEPSAAGTLSAFTTYWVGEILSQNHFSATPMTAVSKDAFQKSRTCTTAGDICKDSSGISYYWSQTTQLQYQINEPSNWASSSNGKPNIVQSGYEKSAFGIFQYLETTNIYLPVLFDGAYNCTLEGEAGGSAINFAADGSLDVACLSSLPMYLSKGSSCPANAVQVGGKCPFGLNV